MEPFESKDGRLIIPEEHIVDFTGRNNSSKGKVLIYLAHIKGKYLTALQLHQATGVSYDYLRQRLSFWYNIRYINRKVIAPAKGRPKWTYCIAERGLNFVDVRLPDDKRNQYIKEINDFTEKGKNS